jgi:anti-anti-sigma regulatory factor
MDVKIDTKEIFHVISILDSEATANMSASFLDIIAKKQEQDSKSLILNISNLVNIDEEFGQTLVKLSSSFYSEKKSFVICNMSEPVKNLLSELDLLNQLNTTPTESEAWDIVQMEEIERELDADFSE